MLNIPYLVSEKINSEGDKVDSVDSLCKNVLHAL